MALASRTGTRGMFFFYVFAQRHERVPPLADLVDLGPQEAVDSKYVHDTAVRDGTWHIIGRQPSWQRDQWPEREYGVFGGDVWFRVVWDDDDQDVWKHVPDPTARTLPRPSFIGPTGIETSISLRLRTRFNLVTPGTWFWFRMKTNEIAVGLVTRTNQNATRCHAYFFSEGWLEPPALEQLVTLGPENTVLELRILDTGFLWGHWSTLGVHADWERTDWPMTPSWRSEWTNTSLEVKYYLVVYDDDDIDIVVSDTQQVPSTKPYLNRGGLDHALTADLVERAIVDRARTAVREQKKQARALEREAQKRAKSEERERAKQLKLAAKAAKSKRNET